MEGGQLKGGDYTFILTDLNTPDHPEQWKQMMRMVK